MITATAPQAVVTSYLDSLAAAPDSVKTTFTGLSGKTYWERYLYTGSGRIDSLWTAGSSTSLTGRRWIWSSVNGNLQNMRLSAGNTTTTVYWDPNRRLTIRISVPAVTDSLRWTTAGALAALASNQVTLERLKRRSERDLAGRMRSEFWDAGPAEFGNFFGYDGLSRLKADSAAMVAWDLCTWDDEDGYICPPEALEITSVESYVWDSVGNLRSRTGPGGSVTGTYGTGNRIQSFAGCTYATDNDGNVTSRTGTCGSAITVWWSPENRLDSLTLAGVKKRFSYDAHGRLARLDDNGTKRYFVWDGANLLAELDAAGARRGEYSYYPGLDNLHAFIGSSGTPYFAHRDHLGNEILLSDASGIAKRVYEYGRWGPLTGGYDNAGFADADRARWKGALWFPEAGLYYMRNRWYETESGRFTCEDPIGLAGGINRYVFAGNNHVDGRDPTGLYGPPRHDGWPGRKDHFNDFIDDALGDYTVFDGSEGGERLGGGGGERDSGACIAAIGGAIFSGAEDLLTLTGVGLVYKGFKTARFVATLATSGSSKRTVRAGDEFVRRQLQRTQNRTRFREPANIALGAASGLLVGAHTQARGGDLVNLGADGLRIAASLTPIANVTLATFDAVRTCRKR